MNLFEMKDVNLYVMAGGIGSRFWPKSRNSFPKQFLDILGLDKSLLQMTVERFAPLIDYEDIHVVTNKDYTKLVAEQLPMIDSLKIISEPSRNNTGPCIAYAAFKLFKRNPDAVMVIVPSDHLILKEEEYLSAIGKAVKFAKTSGALVTLGVAPTRPDTGYGYIRYSNDIELMDNLHKVVSFEEKPNTVKAKEYISSGEYLWNAGMFIWKVSSIIGAFKELAPEIYKLFNEGLEFFNTSLEKDFVDAKYPLLPNISIDYAIMENAKNVFTLPVDIGWSDLGTWNSLHDVYVGKDCNNNASILKNIYLEDSSGCIINAADRKMVVINGLKDFIIVDNENVLLIYPKNKEQNIKDVTNKLKNEGLFEFL